MNDVVRLILLPGLVGLAQLFAPIDAQLPLADGGVDTVGLRMMARMSEPEVAPCCS
jgi:hypothetical protein